MLKSSEIVVGLNWMAGVGITSGETHLHDSRSRSQAELPGKKLFQGNRCKECQNPKGRDHAWGCAQEKCPFSQHTLAECHHFAIVVGSRKRKTKSQLRKIKRLLAAKDFRVPVDGFGIRIIELLQEVIPDRCGW